MSASRLMLTNLTSIGMVCRDNKSSIFASLVKKIIDVPVLILEAIAIREALGMERDRNMDKIVSEGDL